MTIDALRERLGHAFREPALLVQALTHRSHAAVHNERLEFVGDAVLDCVVALALYERFPGVPEGELSRRRANLVNEQVLARLASDLDVGAALRLGAGALRSGAAQRPSILADALEAIFGAIFLDGGFDAARAVIERVYAVELAQAVPEASGKDPKTRLQEWLQARRIAVPTYTVTGASGEAHARTFTVECAIPALGIATTGGGYSRRAAEQEAARHAYDQAIAARPDE
jgi:ribonuclease-3